VVPQQIGTDRLFIRSQGRMSNMTSVAIRAAGGNVANATGAIDAIFPTAADLPSGATAILLAVRFTARMDILPSAGPFLIAAVSDAGTSIISVDPANGSYDATLTVPTAAARVGDFSAAAAVSQFFVIDLLTCRQGPAGVMCDPFPGNLIPRDRISRGEALAVDQIPLPNMPGAPGATGIFKALGTARRGSTFVIDAQNNSSVSLFGGYLLLPVPPALTGANSTGTTTLKLFIDGQTVASKDVTYRVLPF